MLTLTPQLVQCLGAALCVLSLLSTGVVWFALQMNGRVSQQEDDSWMFPNRPTERRG